VMQQMELPMSRSTDPASSYDAADELVKSGRLKAQQAEVLEAVRRLPGRTSRELGLLSAFLDRYDFARRLPELEEAGLIERGEIRECTVGTRTALTWWPKADPGSPDERPESQGNCERGMDG